MSCPNTMYYFSIGGAGCSNTMLSAALKFNRSLIPQTVSEKAGLISCSCFSVLTSILRTRSPLSEEGLHASVSTSGRRSELFPKYFFELRRAVPYFCSKLASAVRTARTASQPSLCHQNSRRWRPAAFLQVQTELHWVGCILDSEQNSKQINLNTSGIYSLSRLTVPNYFKWVFS